MEREQCLLSKLGRKKYPSGVRFIVRSQEANPRFSGCQGTLPARKTTLLGDALGWVGAPHSLTYFPLSSDCDSLSQAANTKTCSL